MTFQDFQDKYIQKDFLILYFIVFFFLYFFCSFIKFLGQWPVLMIISFVLAVFLQNRYNLGKAS